MIAARWVSRPVVLACVDRCLTSVTISQPTRCDSQPVGALKAHNPLWQQARQQDLNDTFGYACRPTRRGSGPLGWLSTVFTDTLLTHARNGETPFSPLLHSAPSAAWLWPRRAGVVPIANRASVQVSNRQLCTGHNFNHLVLFIMPALATFRLPQIRLPSLAVLSPTASFLAFPCTHSLA